MAVPKGKRYTSSVLYLYKATQIVRQVQIMYRQLSKHPKRCEGKHLIDLAYALEKYVNCCNAVYVTNVEEYRVKMDYATRAYAVARALLSQVDYLIEAPIKVIVKEKHEFAGDVQHKKAVYKTGLLLSICGLLGDEIELLKGVIIKTRESGKKFLE